MNDPATDLSPIIVAGMHRSGTSIITRLLSKLGLFAGSVLEQNHESPFFIAVNDLLLSCAHASWDFPLSFTKLWSDDAIINRLAGLAWQILGSQENLTKYCHGIADTSRLAEIPWAWKDPRNTITMPVWLKLFPRARILFVYRNGVDVASSLQRRAAADTQMFLTASNADVLGQVRFISFRCRNVVDAFALWEEYNATWLEFRRSLVGNRPVVIDICYEEFLNEPVPALNRLANRLGLPASQKKIRMACEQLRPSRRYAFLGNPELMDFYRQVSDGTVMKSLGYSTIEARDGG